MKAAVVFTNAARIDRRRTRAWYQQLGSGAPSRLRLARLEAAIARLPEALLAHPAGPISGTRMLNTQLHRVVYRILPGRADGQTEETIEILRIYGPGQSSD